MTCHRVGAALALYSLELSVGNTLLLQISDNRLCALQRQRDVDGVGTSLVGMAIDIDTAIGILLQDAGKLCEVSLRGGAQSRRIQWEEYSRVEGDLDHLQTVGIGNLFHLGVLHLCSRLLSHLVHTMTNDGSRARAYGSANSRANGSSLRVLADNVAYDTTENSTCSCADSFVLQLTRVRRHSPAAIDFMCFIILSFLFLFRSH